MGLALVKRPRDVVTKINHPGTVLKEEAPVIVGGKAYQTEAVEVGAVTSVSALEEN